MAIVIGVRFKKPGKVYYFDPCGLDVKMDDPVVVETVRGVEMGECARAPYEVPDEEIVPPLRKVVRIATDEDITQVEQNRENERKAYDICQEKIAHHKLEMKLVDVEYAFDCSKIIFYFTANGRVDFRALVKDLAAVFKTRIELRQIGVRDEAKMLGGLGPCGRPICCGTFLGDFQPVSIKMAKEQNLSLNPTKISGLCGRLMCCLKYEQDNYEAARKRMPRVGKDVITPDGRGHVIDINVLRETVRVRFQNGDTVEVKEYNAADVQRLGAAEQDKKPAQGAEAAEDETLAADAETFDAEAETIDEALRALESADANEAPEEKPQPPAKKPQKPPVTGRRTQQRRPQGEKPQQQEGEKRRPPRGEGARRGDRPKKPQQEAAKKTPNQTPNPNGAESERKPNSRPPRRRRPNNGPRKEKPQGEQPPKQPE